MKAVMGEGATVGVLYVWWKGDAGSCIIFSWRERLLAQKKGRPLGKLLISLRDKVRAVGLLSMHSPHSTLYNPKECSSGKKKVDKQMLHRG